METVFSMATLNTPETVFFVGLPDRLPIHHDDYNSVVIADSIGRSLTDGKKADLLVAFGMTTANLYAGAILNRFGLPDYTLVRSDLGRCQNKKKKVKSLSGGGDVQFKIKPFRLSKALEFAKPGQVTILVGSSQCLQPVMTKLIKRFWGIQIDRARSEMLASVRLGVATVCNRWPENPMVVSLPLLYV